MFLILLAATLSTPTALLPPPPLATRVLDPAVVRTAVSVALVKSEQTTAEKTADYAAGDTIARSREQARFSRTFDESRIPDCLHPDGLKNQFVPLGGVYAIPFVLVAKLRGKCN